MSDSNRIGSAPRPENSGYGRTRAPQDASDVVTVVFEPGSVAPVYYMLYGFTASGSGVALSSGWISGTTTIPVSGYSGYRCYASGNPVPASQDMTADSTVTVVFGTQQDFYTILWSLFQYIGTRWNNGANCIMPEWQFQRVIDWQVGLDPTYALHYAAAIAEYTRLLQTLKSVDQALAALFDENQLPDPSLPDVQTYVLGEFMTWQVAFGGFRAFGAPYVNYSGWMGGGTFNQTPPPYRALSPSGVSSRE